MPVSTCEDPDQNEVFQATSSGGVEGMRELVPVAALIATQVADPLARIELPDRKSLEA